MKQKREGGQVWQDIWANHSKTWVLQLNTRIDGDQLDENPPFEPLEQISIKEQSNPDSTPDSTDQVHCVSIRWCDLAL
jgi:hypothetical protein